MEKIKQNIKLSCKSCGNEWVYKGVNPFYACCSFCRRIINIKKNKAVKSASSESEV